MVFSVFSVDGIRFKQIHLLEALCEETSPVQAT